MNANVTVADTPEFEDFFDFDDVAIQRHKKLLAKDLGIQYAGENADKGMATEYQGISAYNHAYIETMHANATKNFEATGSIYNSAVTVTISACMVAWRGVGRPNIG